MIWREACAWWRKFERTHSRQSSRISQAAHRPRRIARRRYPASEILPRSHTLRVFPPRFASRRASVRTFLTVFVRTRPCVPDKITHRSSVSSLPFHRVRLERVASRRVHGVRFRPRTMLACFACEREGSRDGRGRPRRGRAGRIRTDGDL